MFNVSEPHMMVVKLQAGRLAHVILHIPNMELALGPLHLPIQGSRGLAHDVAQNVQAAPVRHAHFNTPHPMLSAAGH